MASFRLALFCLFVWRKEATQKDKKKNAKQKAKRRHAKTRKDGICRLFARRYYVLSRGVFSSFCMASFRLLVFLHSVFLFCCMASFRLLTLRLFIFLAFRVTSFRGEKTKQHKPATIVNREIEIIKMSCMPFSFGNFRIIHVS